MHPVDDGKNGTILPGPTTVICYKAFFGFYCRLVEPHLTNPVCKLSISSTVCLCFQLNKYLKTLSCFGILSERGVAHLLQESTRCILDKLQILFECNIWKKLHSKAYIIDKCAPRIQIESFSVEKCFFLLSKAKS